MGNAGLDLFGSRFVDKDGVEHGVEAISGYKLLFVVYTASW